MSTSVKATLYETIDQELKIAAQMIGMGVIDPELEDRR